MNKLTNLHQSNWFGANILSFVLMPLKMHSSKNNSKICFALIKLNYYRIENHDCNQSNFEKFLHRLIFIMFCMNCFFFKSKCFMFTLFWERFRDSSIKKTFVTLDIQWEKTNLFPKYLIITAIIANWLNKFNKHIWRRSRMVQRFLY